MRAPLALVAMLALVAACHRAEQAPGTTTPAEDQQLNDAAAALDANSMEVNAVDANATDNGDDEGDGQ